MFFDDWQGVYRTLVVGVLAYVALILLLRISGKRTLSKMNAFDFVVTVALGSTLATILLSQDVALVEGVVALALLIFLQYIITWLSIRSKTVRSLTKAEPRLLYFQGEFLWQAMKDERVNREEILQSIRSQGTGDVENVGAVILETDGRLSILTNTGNSDSTAMENVRPVEARS